MSDTEQDSPLRFFVDNFKQQHSCDYMDFYHDVLGLFENRDDKLTNHDHAEILRWVADTIDKKS